MKEVIAFAVSLGVVVYWKFDVLSIDFIDDANTRLGYALTAAIIGGGSKGSIKLFHDVLGVKRSARQERDGAYVGGGSGFHPLGNPVERYHHGGSSQLK